MTELMERENDRNYLYAVKKNILYIQQILDENSQNRIKGNLIVQEGLVIGSHRKINCDFRQTDIHTGMSFY